MNVLLTLSCNLLLTLFCFSQKECNLPEQKEYTAVKPERVEWKPVQLKQSVQVSPRAFHIEDALPKGYVKDGSEDYTSYIQLAISKYSDIVFPPFPLLINDNGLKIGSNKTLIFSKGSELRLKPSRKAHYQILFINNASHVKLVNPVVVGDRETHLGTSGEWGMGIRISSSSYVSIYNPKVSECWGDGIYISRNKGKAAPSDINIVNAYCRKNRRNGISVISANGLVLQNPYLAYNDGTGPYCGLDIEPNYPGDSIRNIKIIKPHTEYNPGKGISIGLNRMYGDGDRQVSIDIINPYDYGSRFGFLVSCSAEKSVNGEKISGYVKVSDPIWKMNESGATRFLLSQLAMKVSISNPQVTSTTGEVLNSKETRETLNTFNNKNVFINF